jgi:hypothetical protein
MFHDGRPFSADSVPAIKNIYTTRNSSMCTVLYEVTMQDGLSVKIPVSETTDILKRKTETIYVTEKLTTLLMKTISVMYPFHETYERIAIGSLTTHCPYNCLCPCILDSFHPSNPWSSSVIPSWWQPIQHFLQTYTLDMSGTYKLLCLCTITNRIS